MLAAALLTAVGYQWLFTGTTAGFLASAALIVSVALPKRAPAAREEGRWTRAARGFRLYAATPRLRALMCMHLAVAAATAMVIVNTVVLTQGMFGRGAGDVAIALGAFGIGSMIVAFLTPWALRRVTDRQFMVPAAFVLGAGLIALAAGLAGGTLGWGGLLAIWFALGTGTAAILTPTGRSVTASAAPNDRPAAFAAQFSLSHGWFLLTYPIAGWLAAEISIGSAAAVLAGIAVAAALTGFIAWPSRDATAVAHVHAGLGPADPHLADARRTADGWIHVHDFTIDELHRHWPRSGSTRPCDAGRRVPVESRS
jgi:hypothetical protein